MKRQKIIDIANSLSNKDIVQLLMHLSDRLTIWHPPLEHMEAGQVIWVSLDGSGIDLTTDTLEAYLISEKEREAATDKGEGEAA
jgi:hypothetical protein